MILIVLAIAAICKALSDTLDHHFFTSIFKNKKQSFWNPNVITKTGKQIFGYPLDVWHISNSIQILCWLSLMPVYKFVYKSVLPHWSLDVIVAGLFFNLVFNIFYNKIFR